ncbi:MAG: sugar transferase, partial [Endomicrobiales bacterium]
AAILRVTPGITDRASLKYRDEEALLARASAPEKYYREAVLPDKMEENLSYIEHGRGFVNDVAIILKTLARIFT